MTPSVPMTRSRPIWLLPMTVLGTLMMMMCCCSSEAFASKYHNSFFGRRCLRGGATTSTDTVTCVLQAPPRISSLQDAFEGSEGEPTRRNGAARAFYRPKRYVGVEDTMIQDVITAAEYVAETKLPTDIGQFQLRAYRIPGSHQNEPCVIYSREKPPFGNATQYAQHVPVRIHDQCLTSEVFRSQRYVYYTFISCTFS
jgi:GTP cyclohydrolase II